MQSFKCDVTILTDASQNPYSAPWFWKETNGSIEKKNELVLSAFPLFKRWINKISNQQFVSLYFKPSHCSHKKSNTQSIQVIEVFHFIHIWATIFIWIISYHNGNLVFNVNVDLYVNTPIGADVYPELPSK